MSSRNLFTSILMACLLVLGIGAATSYLADRPEASRAGSSGEMLASLKDYTRSIGTERPASVAAAGKMVPDVSTMIERLAARLKTTPEDINGWRMLGWSYVHMQRYEEAAAAYGRAVALDPSSAALKLLHEEAKAKASETAASLPTEAGGKDAGAEAPHKHDAEIRAMVDGLADRLKSSPRDVEGWIRLMRSRVVLGEQQVAATAFRRALEVFKDDAAASGRIAAAAIELGLKAE
jgi:cytochrome c-type biogenesis protein CcmH